MSRSALKDVLLDLKAQMRSRRASSYGKKKKDGDADDQGKGKKDGDADDAGPRGPVEAKSAATKAPKEPDLAPKGKEKVDFSEEIKNFMKNKRTAKAEPGTAEGFAKMSSPQKPKAEKKGK
jgi:hypothetical protein